MPSIITLADRYHTAVASDPDWPQGSLRRPWYMTTIDNPVISALWRRYCRENGISGHDNPSDRERLAFELCLLHPSVRQEVEVYTAQREAELLRHKGGL